MSLLAKLTRLAFGRAGTDADDGLEEDLAFFVMRPERRHRARPMTEYERRAYEAAIKLSAIPLPAGFAWIVATRFEGDNRVTRVPAAFPARVNPTGLWEEKAAQLWETAQTPLREWSRFLEEEAA